MEAGDTSPGGILTSTQRAPGHHHAGIKSWCMRRWKGHLSMALLSGASHPWTLRTPQISPPSGERSTVQSVTHPSPLACFK